MKTNAILDRDFRSTRTARALSLAVLLATGPVLASEIGLSGIELRTDPPAARVRPYESAVIQLVAYGEITDDEGKTKKVRIRPGRAEFTITQQNG